MLGTCRPPGPGVGRRRRSGKLVDAGMEHAGEDAGRVSTGNGSACALTGPTPARVDEADRDRALGEERPAAARRLTETCGIPPRTERTATRADPGPPVHRVPPAPAPPGLDHCRELKGCGGAAPAWTARLDGASSSGCPPTATSSPDWSTATVSPSSPPPLTRAGLDKLAERVTAGS
ncbi:hypothetical protein HBB16_08520 [Pseudonocardia sp. MCCB 268]|nr:hypothetical protein [Pseudonocardia cytotoxica]